MEGMAYLITWKAGSDVYLELDHLKNTLTAGSGAGFIPYPGTGPASVHLGASGCGKTTTLNMIGGFLEPTAAACGWMARTSPVSSGTEACDNRLPVLRPVSPHDSAPECGLRPEIPGSEAGTGPTEGMRYLEMVGLGDYASAYIQEISGGQQQRVALPGR